MLAMTVMMKPGWSKSNDALFDANILRWDRSKNRLWRRPGLSDKIKTQQGVDAVIC